YVPSPATSRVTGPKAALVQLFGPYAVHVICPPAGEPAVPVVLNGGGPVGCDAVPLRRAVSLIGWPRAVDDEAVVTSVGVTAFTVKHSALVPSVAGGTPAEVELNSARKQYRPTEVTVVVADRIGSDVA